MLVFLCMSFHLCMLALLFMLVLLCMLCMLIPPKGAGPMAIMLWHNGYVTNILAEAAFCVFLGVSGCPGGHPGLQRFRPCLIFTGSSSSGSCGSFLHCTASCKRRTCIIKCNAWQNNWL